MRIDRTICTELKEKYFLTVYFCHRLMGDKNSPMIRMGYIKNKLSTRMVEFTFREKYFKCCIQKTKFL